MFTVLWGLRGHFATQCLLLTFCDLMLQAAKTRTKISSDSAKRLSNLATGVVCDKASAVATTAVRAASSAVKNYTPKTRLGSSLKNMMISHTETSTTNACEQTSSISLEILESTALEETNLSFRVRELDTDVQSKVFDGEYPMVPGSPNAPAPPIHIALFPPGEWLLNQLTRCSQVFPAHIFTISFWRFALLAMLESYD